ncbi:hypothetical protein ABC733_12955 [Mangrovibacter sp. SLW1]
MLLKRAGSLMEQLCLQVNQSCHLSQYSNGQLVVIARQESPYKMGFSLRTGAHLDICASGSGIVLLSYSEESERQRMIKLDDATDEQVAYARSQIATTLEQGYYLGKAHKYLGSRISAHRYLVPAGICWPLSLCHT